MSAKVRLSQVCEDKRAAAAAEQRRTGLPVSDCASGHEDGGAGANRVDGRCAWRSGEGDRQDWALPATRRARHEGRAAAVARRSAFDCAIKIRRVASCWGAGFSARREKVRLCGRLRRPAVLCRRHGRGETGLLARVGSLLAGLVHTGGRKTFFDVTQQFLLTKIDEKCPHGQIFWV